MGTQLAPYAVGTATVTAGSALVSGTGTNWLGALGPYGGDFIIGGVNAGHVISVESNTKLTLANPWQGSSLTRQPYSAGRYLQNTDAEILGPKVAQLYEDTITLSADVADAAQKSALAAQTAAASATTALTGSNDNKNLASASATAAATSASAAAASALASATAVAAVSTRVDGVATTLTTLSNTVVANKTAADLIPPRVAALEASQQAGRVLRQTYAEIAAMTLVATTTYEVLDSDTGSHTGLSTEVGATGTSVPNAGVFLPSGSPLTLKRVSATGVSTVPLLNTNLSFLQRVGAYRPSDILANWTSSALWGDTAPSLALTTPFSLVDAPDGKAIRVASGSTIGIGPKRGMPVYAGDTYEFTPFYSRVADGSDTSLVIRLRGYMADGTATSTMLLATKTLLAADGFRADSVVVTGAAIKAALPTAITVRPYVGRSSTGGSFDISDIRIRLVESGIGALNAFLTNAYFSRPGELISSWTKDISLSSTSAPALLAATGYAVVDGIAGKALRLTGVANAGPIAWTRLEDNSIFEFKFILAGVVDDPVASNNTPGLRFRCFSNLGVDLGPAFLTATPALTAAGVKTYTIKASLVPGSGTNELLANTRYIRPYVVTAGTTGSFDLYAIHLRDLTNVTVGSVAPITATTFPLNARFGLTLVDLATGEQAALTNADTIKWIQETAMADRFPYYFDASGKYSKTPKDGIAAAQDGSVTAGALNFKNESPTGYAAIAFGEDAVLFSDGSETYAPGAGFYYDRVPPGRVSIITDTDASPVTLRYWRAVNADPNSPAKVATHLARYTATVTANQRIAISNFYTGLLESGWIDMIQSNLGCIWVGRSMNNFDALLDWSHPTRTFDRVTINSAALPSTTVNGTVFNGSNAIDTIIQPPASAVNRHTLFVASDTADGAGKVALGNAGIRIAPNRTPTSALLYAGGGSLIVPVPAAGGLLGYSRPNSAGIRLYRNGTTKTDIADIADDTTLGSGSLYLGGMRAIGGLTFGYVGTLDFSLQLYGAIPTDAMVDKLDALLTAYRAQIVL